MAQSSAQVRAPEPPEEKEPAMVLAPVPQRQPPRKPRKPKPGKPRKPRKPKKLRKLMEHRDQRKTRHYSR
jgi:hypothetical protein